MAVDDQSAAGHLCSGAGLAAHRFVDEQIEVEVDRQRKPRSFFWRDRHQTVAEIVDSWMLRTLWWDGEVERYYIQVMTTDLSVYTLFQCGKSQQWFMDTELA